MGAALSSLFLIAGFGPGWAVAALLVTPSSLPQAVSGFLGVAGSGGLATRLLMSCRTVWGGGVPGRAEGMWTGRPGRCRRETASNHHLGAVVQGGKSPPVISSATFNHRVTQDCCEQTKLRSRGLTHPKQCRQCRCPLPSKINQPFPNKYKHILKVPT